MNLRFGRSAVVLGIFVLSLAEAHAEEKFFHWQGTTAPQCQSLDAILAQVNGELAVEQGSGFLPLVSDQFFLTEERELGRWTFRVWKQKAGKYAVRGKSIRSWCPLQFVDASAAQVEANVDLGALGLFKAYAHAQEKGDEAAPEAGVLPEGVLVEKARTQVPADAGKVLSHKTSTEWVNWSLVSRVTLKTKRGTVQVDLGAETGRVMKAEFRPYEKSDRLIDRFKRWLSPKSPAGRDSRLLSFSDEYSVPANVYPIWEEAGDSGPLQQRQMAELKYLKNTSVAMDQDYLAPLRERTYEESKMDSEQAKTPEGLAAGYWSMDWLRSQANALLVKVGVVDNSLTSSPGARLDGRYVSVSWHPDATKFLADTAPLSFTPRYAPFFMPVFKESESGNTIVPGTAWFGRPLAGLMDAQSRVARRLPDHSPGEYMRDGFDEVQVYFAVNQLMESLRQGGFNDPELSTRRWLAFLYDPDISMRDNAYYTDDTINFTTYSPESMNYARDNSTIWHELGHGVMDRLMGPDLNLADTGGLSEGMADFVAQLVVNDVTGGAAFEGKEKFRILNQMGFLLTNEVHDDGEAYGGAMNDFLEAAMRREGRQGLVAITSLTLDAMRLARNHPHLTAEDWFGYVLRADELGQEGFRAPGAYGDLIRAALASRNFTRASQQPATYTLKNGYSEVMSYGPGSRGSPIAVNPKNKGEGRFVLSVSVSNQGRDVFRFPVTVTASFRGGPLQGGVKWLGEDKGEVKVTLNSDGDLARIPVQALPGCDSVNRDDGSCVDFVYLQVTSQGEKLPRAKKRFYVRVTP